jgi:hypothetical protein
LKWLVINKKNNCNQSSFEKKKQHKTKRDFNFNIYTNIAITTLGKPTSKKKKEKNKQKHLTSSKTKKTAL